VAELCIDELVRGLIDMHLHTGPDVFLCRIDALEEAKQAELGERGWLGFLLFPQP